MSPTTNKKTPPPNVTVSDDGTTLTVTFPTTTTTTSTSSSSSPLSNNNKSLFHAPWLWSNCPTSIHPTSGQRLRTPGDYRDDIIIKEASIITSCEATRKFFIINNTNDDADNVSSYVPTPSPPGSCHPMGTVFKSETTTTTRWFLAIKWSDTSYPTSYYDLQWLHRWRYDNPSLTKRRRRTEILHPRLSASTELATFDYHDLVNVKNDDDDHHHHLFHLLHNLFHTGAILITNTPPHATAVHAIAHLLSPPVGPSHTSLYGSPFHVKSLPSSHNIAYTSHVLPPHQDLAYYESPPGVQLLHCLSNPDANVMEGGESLLIDAMAAASELRRLDGECFRTLVRCPATFVKEREGACMMYRRAHIVLSSEGEGDDDGDDDDLMTTREIVGVNWAPAFEGPLCLPPEKVGGYYKAYGVFQRMLDVCMESRCGGGNDDGSSRRKEEEEMSMYEAYARENTWERRLKEGEMIVFNNRRMLHGRRAFRWTTTNGNDDDGAVAEKGRHLVGAYTDIDDTLNNYRVLLRRKKGLELDNGLFSIPNVANGTSSIP